MRKRPNICPIFSKSNNFAHLQNLKFGCDGLNTLWRRNISQHDYQRMSWQQNFGKFSHDFEGIITKGFRRHEMTLADGHEVVVYDLHMDASSERDELKQNDATMTPDRT